MAELGAAWARLVVATACQRVPRCDRGWCTLGCTLARQDRLTNAAPTWVIVRSMSHAAWLVGAPTAVLTHRTRDRQSCSPRASPSERGRGANNSAVCFAAPDERPDGTAIREVAPRASDCARSARRRAADTARPAQTHAPSAPESSSAAIHATSGQKLTRLEAKSISAGSRAALTRATYLLGAVTPGSFAENSSSLSQQRHAFSH